MPWIVGSAALQTDRGPVNRLCWSSPEGTTHFYDKRHPFRMAEEHHQYEAGNERVVLSGAAGEFCRWCVMTCASRWSRNHNDYDLALWANWPALRSLQWQSLLAARPSEIWPMLPAVTASAPMATAIITAAIAVHYQPAGEIWQRQNLIRQRV